MPWLGIKSEQSEPTGAKCARILLISNIVCFSEALSQNGLSIHHIVAVNLLLQDMASFPSVNKAYVSHFDINPPIRVCVEAPIEAKVSLSAIGKKPSAAVSCSKIETMHVQSISHWAPANIGPYSQATFVSNCTLKEAHRVFQMMETLSNFWQVSIFNYH